MAADDGALDRSWEAGVDPVAGEEEVRQEFKYLKYLYDKFKNLDIPNCRFSTLSMGMSDDFEAAWQFITGRVERLLETTKT